MKRQQLTSACYPAVHFGAPQRFGSPPGSTYLEGLPADGDQIKAVTSAVWFRGSGIMILSLEVKPLLCFHLILSLSALAPPPNLLSSTRGFMGPVTCFKSRPRLMQRSARPLVEGQAPGTFAPSSERLMLVVLVLGRV